MAHKGFWLARSMRIEGGLCKCPNNTRRQGRWPLHDPEPAPAEKVPLIYLFRFFIPLASLELLFFIVETCMQLDDGLLKLFIS
jgi:hypothetical protein